jgi:hypothetical protein
VILKSEKHVSKIPISWKLGIDVARDIQTGETLVDIYDNNKASGDSIGGPVCKFQNKDLTCFVCTSPNASITSKLLAEMLGTIDKASTFSQNEGQSVPFLLLYGHHSQTSLPFLNYINHPDHPCKVCIGVPYATHM